MNFIFDYIDLKIHSEIDIKAKIPLSTKNTKASIRENVILHTW